MPYLVLLSRSRFSESHSDLDCQIQSKSKSTCPKVHTPKEKARKDPSRKLPRRHTTSTWSPKPRRSECCGPLASRRAPWTHRSGNSVVTSRFLPVLGRNFKVIGVLFGWFGSACAPENGLDAVFGDPPRQEEKKEYQKESTRAKNRGFGTIGVLFGWFGRKNRWRFLVCLVVPSYTRETHLFAVKRTPMFGALRPTTGDGQIRGTFARYG